MVNIDFSNLSRATTFSSTAVETGEDTWWNKVEAWSREHLNFFRIHLIVIVSVSFIASGIFYASRKEEDNIRYIDALFLCVSATTVTGLQTILINPLSRWQQVILYICTQIGSIPVVAFLTVIIRLHFFREAIQTAVETNPGLLKRFRKQVVRTFTTRPTQASGAAEGTGWLKKWVEKTEKEQEEKEQAEGQEEVAEERKEAERREGQSDATSATRVSDANEPAMATNSEGQGTAEIRTEAQQPSAALQRRTTINFASPPSSTPASRPDDHIRFRKAARKVPAIAIIASPSSTSDPSENAGVQRGIPLSAVTSSPTSYAFGESPFRQGTMAYEPKAGIGNGLHGGTAGGQKNPALYSEVGGFRNPVWEIAKWSARQAHRRLTMVQTQTQGSGIKRTKTGLGEEEGVEEVELEDVWDKVVGYLSFDVRGKVGKNSNFKRLTLEEQEELGGVEYKALMALAWIVGGYWVGLQLISTIILAPYFKAGHFKDIFQANGDPNTTWYSFFQVASSLANNGMSLVDASLVPFRETYLLSIMCALLIVAGNTGYPIFLRFIIWTLNKIRPSPSLQFLLDHPRRCFLYLFPSYQTWFLVIILFVFLVVDWLSLLLLNIDLEVIESIPLGQRVGLTLIQSLLIRSAGMQLIPVGSLSPAQQFWYAVLMYITVYPIAVSIRSTNVYENKSVGVFEEDSDSEAEEADLDKKNDPGEYVGYHVRKLLEFDIWWLVFGIWLICVSERALIRNSSNNDWFNFQTVLFEVTSAYGTTGLSTGVPYASYSLSGAFNTFSKLVICVVMIRGRHRGLPLAIDRSVLLPSTLEEHGEFRAPGQGERERKMTMMAEQHAGREEAAGPTSSPPIVQDVDDTVVDSPTSVERTVSFEPR
ncbi:TrkH-domain-containing protein [Atractiella rhizophila]|nr:TrkH-domain-containing protein [Atractiella rhizophila]